MQADKQLSKSLKPRHLSMIAIAGVMGAGPFVGSGAAIEEAGPGIGLWRYRKHGGSPRGDGGGVTAAGEAPAEASVGAGSAS